MDFIDTFLLFLGARKVAKILDSEAQRKAELEQKKYDLEDEIDELEDEYNDLDDEYDDLDD